MPIFVQDPPHRWAYTFLKPHIELMRDPEANPVRHRSILFRFFTDLTFEEFFTGGTPGKPWFINLTVKRTRAVAGRDESFLAHDVGRIVAENKAPIALLSPPGSGKTTLQLYTFFNCITPGQTLFDAGFVPCFVSAHKMHATFGQQIKASLGMGAYEVDDIERYLESSSRLLFLVDLNRVPYNQQEMFAQKITEELADSESFRAKGHRLILAARNRPELANHLFNAGYELWSIQPLPREEVDNFLRDTLRGVGLSPSHETMLSQLLAEHGELLRNPFHLSLITILLSRDPSSLAELNSTGKLFKLVTDRILDQEFPNWAPLDNAGAPTQRFDATVLNAQTLKSSPKLDRRAHPGDLILQQMARYMTEQGVRSLDMTAEFPDLLHELELRWHSAPWWPRRSGRELADIELEPLIKEHSLFRVSPEGTHLLWLHDIFQDFYAAKFLAFDPETGRPRVQSPGAISSVDQKLIALLEACSTNSRWQEALPFLTDLLEPGHFAQVVRAWGLAKFQRNDRGQLVPKPGGEPNKYVFKHIVHYLETLGWTDELDALIQLPFLKTKVMLLGYESILPDLEARMRYSLADYWDTGEPARFFEAFVQLTVGRAVVFEETEGGAILRDFLDGNASPADTKRRIEAIDDPLLQFFHYILLAEAMARNEAAHSDAASFDTVEEIDSLLKLALQRAISPAQILQQQQDRWLRRDLLDSWAVLHGVDIDLDLFLPLFAKLGLSRKFVMRTLRRIIRLGRPARVLQLVERMAPNFDERRYYKRILKEVTAEYARQWMWNAAINIVEKVPVHHRDELRGVIIETAIRTAAPDKARDLLEQVQQRDLRKYLKKLLAGDELPARTTDDDADDDADDGGAAGALDSEIDAEGSEDSEKEKPPATQSFFVKCRTELLEAFEDREALKLRPPGSRPRRRTAVFAAGDRVSIFARWGHYWWHDGNDSESTRCFKQAKHFARRLGEETEDWLFPQFELYRHLRLTANPEAGAVFAQMMELVNEERHDSPNSPVPLLLGEQCAYWGFLDAAEDVLQLYRKETWHTRGRFYAHYMRHLLAEHSPSEAFHWFRTQPRIDRERDDRWMTWVTTCGTLARAWDAISANDLTRCLQLLDDTRAAIAQFHRDPDQDWFMTYFRGQMLANLVLMCFHHEDLRPVAEREMLHMASPPMRAFCVGHYLRFCRNGVPAELVDSALAALPQFVKNFFRGKIRVVKIWAEAIAKAPEITYRPWLARFLKEVATDPRLMRYILPDLAWALSRHQPDMKTRKDCLSQFLEIADEADSLVRAYS